MLCVLNICLSCQRFTEISTQLNYRFIAKQLPGRPRSAIQLSHRWTSYYTVKPTCRSIRIKPINAMTASSSHTSIIVLTESQPGHRGLRVSFVRACCESLGQVKRYRSVSREQLHRRQRSNSRTPSLDSIVAKHVCPLLSLNIALASAEQAPVGKL